MTVISSSTRFAMLAKNFLAACLVLFALTTQANVGQLTLIHHSSAISCDERLAWSESQDSMDYSGSREAADSSASARTPTPSPLVGEGWGEGFFSTSSPVVGEGRGEGHSGEGPSVASLKAQKSAVHYEPITNLFHSLHEQQLIHITLDTGETIAATAGHPMRTTEGWRTENCSCVSSISTIHGGIDTVLLKRGGKLLIRGDADAHLYETEGGRDVSASLSTATIIDVRTEVKTVAVFNLEVANAHTFFVGEAGYLVHNGRAPAIRRAWERHYNDTWPLNPPTEKIRPGCPQDAQHKKYRRDGGGDEPKNIRPMTPSQHTRFHQSMILETGESPQWHLIKPKRAR